MYEQREKGREAGNIWQEHGSEVNSSARSAQSFTDRARVLTHTLPSRLAHSGTVRNVSRTQGTDPRPVLGEGLERGRALTLSLSESSETRASTHTRREQTRALQLRGTPGRGP